MNPIKQYKSIFLFLCCLTFSVAYSQEGFYEKELLALKPKIFLSPTPESKVFFDKKAKQYLKLLEQKEHQSQIYHLLAITQYANREVDKGKEYIAKALELEPKNSEYIFFKGLLFRLANQHLESAECFENAYQLNDKNPEYLFQAGRTFYFLKNLDRALDEFKKVIEKHPLHDKSWFQIASIYLNKDSIDQALTAYKKCIEINPNMAVYYYNAGHIQYSQKDFAAAEKSFKKALEIDKDDWLSMKKLVQLYSITKRPELANQIHLQIVNLKKLGTIKELADTNYYVRDSFEYKNYKIYGMHYFELLGTTPLVYNFSIFDEKKVEIIKISVGQYIPYEGKKPFHLDAYYPDKSHKIFKFYSEKAPDYETAKSDMLLILENKLNEIKYPSEAK